MSRKKMRSTARFWKGFIKFVLICVFLLALMFAGEFFVLKGFQKNYEKTEAEKYVPEWPASQQAFEDYVGTLTAADWARLWKETHPDCFDGDGALAEIMQAKFLNGGISFARAADYSDEAPAYVVENAEESLAELRLEKSLTGEWSVTGCEFRFSGDKSAELVLPSGCSVFCNGTLLEDRFHDEGSDNYYVKQQIDDIQNRTLWYTWKVEGQLTEPELTYEAPEGKEFYTNDQGLLTVALPEGEEQELYDKANAFFEDFHHYVMYGYFSNKTLAAQAAKHTRAKSQAYTSVYDAYDAIKHAPCYGEYKNDLTLSPIMVWGDNALSLDIGYHTDAMHRGEVTPFDGVYKLLFLDYGEGYELCGLLMQ